jgi:hypothetical protein
MQNLSSDALATIFQYLASREDKLIFWFVCIGQVNFRLKVHQALMSVDSIPNNPAKLCTWGTNYDFQQYINVICCDYDQLHTGDIFECYTPNQRLNKITLKHLSMSNEILAHLIQFQKLHELYLVDIKSINFEYMTNLASLQILSISGKNVIIEDEIDMQNHNLSWLYAGTLNFAKSEIFIRGLDNLSVLSLDFKNKKNQTNQDWNFSELISLNSLTFKDLSQGSRTIIANLANINHLDFTSNVIVDGLFPKVSTTSARITHVVSFKLTKLKRMVNFLAKSPILTDLHVDYNLKNLYSLGMGILDFNFVLSLKYVNKLSISNFDLRKAKFNFDLILDEFILKNSFFTQSCLTNLNKLISHVTKLTLENNVIIHKHGAIYYFCPDFAKHKLKYFKTDLQSQSLLDIDIIKHIVKIPELHLTNTNFLNEITDTKSSRKQTESHIHQIPFLNISTFVKKFRIEHGNLIKTAHKTNNYSDITRILRFDEKILHCDAFGNKICKKFDQPFEFRLQTKEREKLDAYAKNLVRTNAKVYLMVQYLYDKS